MDEYVNDANENSEIDQDPAELDAVHDAVMTESFGPGYPHDLTPAQLRDPGHMEILDGHATRVREPIIENHQKTEHSAGEDGATPARGTWYGSDQNEHHDAGFAGDTPDDEIEVSQFDEEIADSNVQSETDQSAEDGNADDRYDPTAEFKELHAEINEQLSESECDAEREALKGDLETVERSIQHVEGNPICAAKESVWLSHRLTPRIKLDELKNRDAHLRQEKQDILERMHRGELSEDCGVFDLQRNSLKRARLLTRGQMMGVGNDWDDYGELSEAHMHVREDATFPGFMDDREMFRAQPEDVQRELLARCVEHGSMTEEDANWIWTFYR